MGTKLDGNLLPYLTKAGVTIGSRTLPIPNKYWAILIEESEKWFDVFAVKFTTNGEL